MKKVSIFSFVFCLVFAAAAFGQQTIYNSIPSPLPGNLVSLGYEATSTAEFGDRIQFGGTWRKGYQVTQTMSSWGCETGNWQSGCITTPGATFSHPITLNIYNVGPGNSVGSLIASVTKTFAIPYRPSASPACGTRWQDSSGNCWNGLATNITFDLSGVSLPNQVIYSIAYNTTHYGASPIGQSAACFSTFAGCGYDSLNVALEGNPTVGSAPAPLDAYWNTLVAGWYCDGGAGGSGTFRLDAGCWVDPDFSYLLATKFTAVNPPANQNDCKNDGWKTRSRADGSLFKNQGDCVSYTQNGK